MAVLLLAEISNGELNRDATAKAVSAIHNLGDVTVLCVGAFGEGTPEQAARIDGVSNVLVARDASYAQRLAEPLAALIVGLASKFSHIAAPSTTDGKNIMPRVAALLDVMVISDVSKVVASDTFERPIYAGNAIQTVRSRDIVKVMTIRTASFSASGVGEPMPVAEIATAGSLALSTWIANDISQSGRPELTAANRVIAGGRGLGSRENFAIIEQLADKLGAAVAASRAAVDAGYAPNDWQVGQTGKVVAPELYIAIGISGAIQHLAGMKDSRIIVSINKDADAPMLQIADYALVGDLFVLVPELIDKL